MTDIGGEDYFVDIGGDYYWLHALYALHKVWPNLTYEFSQTRGVTTVTDSTGIVNKFEPDESSCETILILYENMGIYETYKEIGVDPSIEDSIVMCITKPNSSAYTFSEKNREQILQIHSDFVTKKYTRDEIEQWASTWVG